MKTYVATTNDGKLAELRAIFAGSILELDTYPGYRAVEEGASSYSDNALLKARALQAQLQADGVKGWVLADDSGLEVEAMEFRPGVLSARYAGVDATWQERRAALLRELDGVPPERRGARFVCYVALLRERGEELVAAGAVAGQITEEVRGEGGFGYDPIVLYPPARRTFAELSDAEKNRVSHRRRAADNLLHILGIHAR